MTNEELDVARAKKAAEIWDPSNGTLATTAARLAREGWMPPVTVDPDLGKLVELLLDRTKEEGEIGGDGFSGFNRDGTLTPVVIAALKFGRALAAAKAKPGMVWVEHDGSKECPVCPDGMVIVIYIDTRNSIYGRAADRDWPCVKYYAVITPPAEDVA